MTYEQLAELNRRLTHDVTRRHFFGRCAVGLGAIALNQLLSEEGFAAGPKIDPENPMAARTEPTRAFRREAQADRTDRPGAAGKSHAGQTFRFPQGQRDVARHEAQ